MTPIKRGEKRSPKIDDGKKEEQQVVACEMEVDGIQTKGTIAIERVIVRHIHDPSIIKWILPFLSVGPPHVCTHDHAKKITSSFDQRPSFMPNGGSVSFTNRKIAAAVDNGRGKYGHKV